MRVRCVCADIGGAVERCNAGLGRGKKATCVSLSPVSATCRVLNDACVAVYIMKL